MRRALSTDLLQRWYVLRADSRMRYVLEIQSSICSSIRKYLTSMGFLELLPPIIGPVTDPGIRGAEQATIDFYGKEYKVMSSAILYKQMMADSCGKIFFFSPNVRMEPLESIRTGRHLVEFVQVDVEEAGASYHDAMTLAEGLLVHVLEEVLRYRKDELAGLERSLEMPTAPFKRLTHQEAMDLLASHGSEPDYSQEVSWESEEYLSGLFGEPFFVYDYPVGSRGFYDREDRARPGILTDFDLLYPDGYGEAISGAEREYEYDSVKQRILSSGEDPTRYGWYMEMLRDGIVPSAGFGIGLERLTRFVCGLGAVWEARPYPKVAGIVSP